MPDSPETAILTAQGDRLELPGARLTVVEGPDRGREASARRGVVRIGSASDNDLVLTDEAVSRRHLEIRLRGDEVHAVDLGSTNGTTVDGLRIVHALLGPASLVRVGTTTIRVTPVAEPVIVPLSSRTSFGGLIGSSPAMREAFAILERVAPSEATVLITGETGTGKELAAEAVHAHSQRAEGPFIAIDCGAIAPSLVESELFGHERGAFTGAVGERRGVFEEAEGGTLFLDEIGELPLEAQPKLLRAIEKREVRRVGAARPRAIDVRIVAATHRDLAELVNRGAFREDLYFRLAVVEVRLPPLRARAHDIPELVHHFSKRFAPDEAPPSPEIVRALAARPWPGNVRELRNAIERACALAKGQRSAPSAPAGPAQLEALLGLELKDAQAQWLEVLQRAYVGHALSRAGTVSGAARLAGVNRKHIQRLMKRFGIANGDDP